jgi:Na+/melibiose symporter-like transporter
MQEIGLTDETIQQSNMSMVFATTFVLQFIAATALDLFLGPESTWQIGLHAGALIGLMWVATSYGVTYMFEQRTMRLFLINAGYYFVLYSVVGAILGGWN